LKLALRASPGSTMEFTLLFLADVIVMLVAWRGPRRLAMGLFAAVLIACVATYLHHATDVLKLSF
jgi:CHASE2 domain-containing sensor protein